MKIIAYVFAVVIIFFNASLYHKVDCLDVDLSACQAYNWNACGIAVGTAIYKRYESWNNTDTKQAFGTTCNLEMKGSFYAFFGDGVSNFGVHHLLQPLREIVQGGKAEQGQ